MSTDNKKVLDIDNIFDDIIKDGYKAKEKEVLPGFTVKLRPLSYNELARAEAEISRRNPSIPDSITVKLRCAKILSFAIISLNGSNIDSPDNPEENEGRRIYLYDRLVNMPTIFVQEAYQLYVDAAREESEFYSHPQAIGEEVENF